MKPNTECANCGKPIYRIPSKIEKQKNNYCGRSCQTGEHSPKWKGGRKKKEFTCINCGEIFFRAVYKERIRRVKFCSRKCRSGEFSSMWKGGRCKTPGGYMTILAPGHPHANNSGHVYEHIIIAERAYGGPLPKGACVHHLDGDKTNNSNKNLIVCDYAYHNLLHQRMRAKDECGDPNALRCGYCGKHDYPINLYLRKKPSNGQYHRRCKNEYDAKWREKNGLRDSQRT